MTGLSKSSTINPLGRFSKVTGIHEGKTKAKYQKGAPGFTKFRNPNKLQRKGKSAGLKGQVVKRKNDPFDQEANTYVQSVMSG
jgi:hypothetical protein